MNADIFEQTQKILEWGGGIGYNESVFDKNRTGILVHIYTIDKKISKPVS